MFVWELSELWEHTQTMRLRFLVNEWMNEGVKNEWESEWAMWSWKWMSETNCLVTRITLRISSLRFGGLVKAFIPKGKLLIRAALSRFRREIPSESIGWPLISGEEVLLPHGAVVVHSTDQHDHKLCAGDVRS